MIIDLDKYRNQLTDEDILEMILKLDEKQLLIVSRVNNMLRVQKIRATRFMVEPEKL